MAMLNNQRVPFSEHRCGQLPGVFAMLVEPRDPLWATGIQGNMMTKNHDDQEPRTKNHGQHCWRICSKAPYAPGATKDLSVDM